MNPPAKHHSFAARIGSATVAWMLGIVVATGLVFSGALGATAWAEPTQPPAPPTPVAPTYPPTVPGETPTHETPEATHTATGAEPTATGTEPTATGTGEATPVPPQQPTDQPEPSSTATEPESAAPETPAGGGVLEAEPPTWQATNQDPWSWGVALVVLIGAAALVVLLSRRPDPREQRPPAGATPAPVPVAGSAESGLASLEAVGEAMIDAGYSVSGIHSALIDIAQVNGYPETEIVVFPTALFVSTRGRGEVHTGAVSSGHFPLRLNQIDALDDVIYSARTRPSKPGEITAGIAAVRNLPAPYSGVQQVVAHSLLSASLSVLLGASWSGVGVAAVLGLGVGFVLMVTREVQSQYRSLITVGVAFGVSAVVFTLAQMGLDPGVVSALIAPLITFLPGGQLTTGVIELATGQMMAGAGRLAAGGMQLILLAAGVVGGANLVGVPQLVLEQAQYPLGPIGPWLAIAVFGFANVVFRGGRSSSIGWTLLVLYVAYGAQVLGGLFFGGVLSALIGAFAMTPVAYLVSRQPNAPAAFASFLPAFWMLVPGALGLIGVASILDGDSAGVTTLVTMASTMVAITLGILIGSALGARLAHEGTATVI